LKKDKDGKYYKASLTGTKAKRLIKTVGVENQGESGWIKDIGFKDKRMVAELMQELHKLFDICGLRNITLRPQFIKSHLNVLAGKRSRLRDHDDWKLNPRIFQEASTRWGTPEVDRFATANNAQCKHFNSRWGDPQSEARDAFTQVWAGTHIWLNPPWGCIGRMLAKVRSASIVVPFWSSEFWYPELLELADDIVYYAPEFYLFLPGVTGSSRAVVPPRRGGILVAHILPRALGEDG
jgi:hypothetical protein